MTEIIISTVKRNSFLVTCFSMVAFNFTIDTGAMKSIMNGNLTIFVSVASEDISSKKSRNTEKTSSKKKWKIEMMMNLMRTLGDKLNDRAADIKQYKTIKEQKEYRDEIGNLREINS